MTGKRFFDIGISNSKYFLYLLYNNYAVINFQKLPGFDDVVIQFYLNFLKFLRLGFDTSPLPSWSLLRPWQHLHEKVE